MYTKCLHCNCQLKNSVYNIYNMRLVITIERLPCEVRTSQASSYVPRHPRPTYLNTHDLRTSTPTPYVAQRLAARACLEAPFTTFGGSIHYVWRLHSLRLEAPFTTFGGSIHYFSRLQSLRLETPNALVRVLRFFLL